MARVQTLIQEKSFPIFFAKFQRAVISYWDSVERSISVFCCLIDFFKAVRTLSQFKHKKKLKIEQPVKNVWAVSGWLFFMAFVEVC